MTNYPFTDPVKTLTLDRQGVEDLLRSFEDAWATKRGERITTAEFYDRYLAGELDSPFATAWASYYEVLRECGREVGEAVTATLVTV